MSFGEYREDAGDALCVWEREIEHIYRLYRVPRVKASEYEVINESERRWCLALSILGWTLRSSWSMSENLQAFSIYLGLNPCSLAKSWNGYCLFIYTPLRCSLKSVGTYSRHLSFRGPLFPLIRYWLCPFTLFCSPFTVFCSRCW